MITISEARNIIQQHIHPMQPVYLPLQETLGLTLARDVYADTDIPAFPQSSMDGYAFSFKDWILKKELSITGEVAAGDRRDAELSPFSAVRIFTGAAVPSGADTVVMQEKIKAVNGKLIIEDEKLQQGSNVRPKSSEIRAGSLALAAGSILTPAAIGFLAGAGIAGVEVFPRPGITIIVTGNELQRPGQRLQYGQVFESNSFALMAALEQLNIRDVKVEWVRDDLQALTKVLQNALNSSDVILLTGGISVGDYDFVLEAATKCDVTPLFYKVKQRPGKPLFLGTMGDKVVFGLPGNPSSVLTCFYIHVVPALERLSNRHMGLRTVQVPLSSTYQKAAGLTHFLKGTFDGNTVRLLGAQESYRMRSFAQSNCLIQMDEETTVCNEGDLVKVHLLPL